MLAVLALVAVAVPALGLQDSTPVSFEELVQAAEQAQRNNHLSAAAMRYKEALAMHPEIAELHANLGLVNYQRGDSTGAQKEFQAALRLKPSLFVPNLFLGVEYLKRNDPSSALLYLTRAAQMNPQDLEVNLSVGRAYSTLNRDSEAISAYWRAVTFHPGNEEGWYGLGASYLDRAESLSSLLAKRYRDSASFGALTASYFDEQGKYARAISEYRAIVANADAPLCSHTRLGFALIHNGQFAEAAPEFNSDLQIGDCTALARNGLARIQIHNGKTSASTKDDVEESNANASAVLADHLLANVSNPAQGYLEGHYREAAALGDKLIASGAVNPKNLYWTIRADQRLGAGALTQAVRVAPGSIRIHLLLGDLYRRKGQYVAGEREFQEALKLDKNNVPALLGLATAYYLNGELNTAEAAAKEVLLHEPGDIEAKLLMAEVLLGQRHYGEAYRFVETVPNGKPDLIAEIHGVRGKILAATHRPTEAISELKEAVDHDSQGDLTYVLARQYQILGDKQSASTAFQRSKKLREKSNEREGYRSEVDRQN